MSTYEISKSSLLSLKAEILKKQEELRKAKLENKIQNPDQVKVKPLDLKNKGVHERAANDLTEEETNLLKLSRAALEAKSKLYDKLRKGSASIDSERKNRYLVRFPSKPDEPLPDFTDEVEDRYSDGDDNIDETQYNAENSDDEWVEYVDCLGRTRTCLKKDLEFIKKNDSNLRKVVKDRESDQNGPEKVDDVEIKDSESKDNDNIDENSEMISADMRRELQRDKWEEEEIELMKKTDVHYQDVLFNEARTHGVGYYGFSKDEDERKRQQENLTKLRKETEEQQKLAQSIKKSREKQLSARILAAKNRKRSRMGLPPLTAEEEAETQVPEETPEKPVEKSEEEIRKEKEKERKRKQHVRPWDVGKDGLKEHKKYSQDEWVEVQREKRDKEFAPPRAYNSTVQLEVPTEDKQGLYFSSKKQTATKPPPARKPVNPYLNPSYTPIRNECSDEDSACDDDVEDEDELMRNFHLVRNAYGAEIPPPPTIDYYGPSDAKRSKSKYDSVDMEDSIMQGLRYLRNKVEQKKSD